MSIRLGPELAALRRQARAASAAIARLAASSPDLGPLTAARARLDDLAQASFHDLVARLATSGAIARALAHLRANRPVPAPEEAARHPSAAAPSMPGALRSAEAEPAARTARRRPARARPRPAGPRPASLPGGGRPAATPDRKRVLPIAVAGSRVARLHPGAPAQGRSPMARAGAGRRVASHPAASPTIGRILAGGRPDAALVAAAVLHDHGIAPGDPPARSDTLADALSKALSRLQRRAGSAASARSFSRTPESAARGERRANPPDAELTPDRPRQSALARLAAAGESLAPRSQEAPDPPAAGILADSGAHAAPPVERSASAPPDMPAHGDEGELAARIATILRREARRAGIDLTGWP